MSVRYEWMHNPLVQAVEAGSLVGEHETSTDALVVMADEGTVIEGDLEEFARAVVAAVVRLGGQLVLNKPGPYVPGSTGTTDEAGVMHWRPSDGEDRALLRGSVLDVPLSVDELAEVLPDVDPGLREDGEPEPWTARRAIVALHQALRVFQSVHDDVEPLVLVDAREAERESAEADRCSHGYYLTGGTGTCPMPAEEHRESERSEVADHPFQGTDGVPGYCTRCGCAPFIHPLRHKMSGDLVPLCGAESGEVCVNDLSVTCEGCLAIVRAATR